MSREKKTEVGTSLGNLLKGVRLDDPAAPKKGAPKKKSRRPSKKKGKIVRRAPKAEPPEPRPSGSLAGEDRAAFMDAMSGVRPLQAKGPPQKTTPAGQLPPSSVAIARTSDADARARLAALVGGGVRFEIERDDERVRGWRVGTARRVALDLERRGVAPEASLDLHGLRVATAERALVRFVREQHGRGVRRICVVHGKGLHSAGGVGVLGDHTLHVLTDGGAAPLVLAFATASTAHGGAGALIVQLVR